MNIQLKRVYDAPAEDDGKRILVDRIWPRGLSKAAARVDLWVKELAPSHALRKWYGHDPEKWEEFRSRYFAELSSRKEEIADLLKFIGAQRVTFLYSSRETRLNNAVVLKEYLEALARGGK